MANIVTRVDGADITIETTDPGGRIQPTSAGAVADRVEGAFDTAVDAVKRVSSQFVQAIAELGDEAPEAFELSFGIKFTATGDVWVAKATTEAQLVAKVAWRRRT